MRTTVPALTSSGENRPMVRASEVPRSISSSSERSHSASPRLAKYSSPMKDTAGSSTMSGLQFLKFWMRPTWTSGAWT